MADTAPPDLRTRYLDLVRNSLIGLLQEDPELAQRADRAVLPFDAERRATGKDWPAHAFSMIGALRMLQLQRAAEFVIERDIPGDFIETGVWRGGACILMRAVLAAHGVRDRSVWVADSFQGLPPPDPGRYPADEGQRLHEYPQLAVSLDAVRENFARFGLLD